MQPPLRVRYPRIRNKGVYPFQLKKGIYSFGKRIYPFAKKEKSLWPKGYISPLVLVTLWKNQWKKGYTSPHRTKRAGTCDCYAQCHVQYWEFIACINCSIRCMGYKFLPVTVCQPFNQNIALGDIGILLGEAEGDSQIQACAVSRYLDKTRRIS